MQPDLIEMIWPEFFAKQRAQGQAEAGIPSDVADLLSGETPLEEGAVPAPDAGPPATTAEEPVDDAARAEEINRALNEPSDGDGAFIETEGQTEASKGGKVPPGGTMPPRPR
jgi:hypothetical protein